MSLDGYIARPDGSYDWIIMDDAIDFPALFAEFDTLLMGRKTYEVVRSEDMGGLITGMKKLVVSRTLQPEGDPNVAIIRENVIDTVAALKAIPGKDIWLFGGGVLFRHLLDASLVDAVELAVMPVLLSEGIPVLAPGRPSPVLKLESRQTLPSGIMMLKYAVTSRAAQPAPDH